MALHTAARPSLHTGPARQVAVLMPGSDLSAHEARSVSIGTPTPAFSLHEEREGASTTGSRNWRQAAVARDPSTQAQASCSRSLSKAFVSTGVRGLSRLIMAFAQPGAPTTA